MKVGFAARIRLTIPGLLITFFAAATPIAAQDLLLESRTDSLRLQARRHDQRDYYRLLSLVSFTGCRVRTEGNTAVVTGPTGHLLLTENRALVRFGTEYILLSSAPWKSEDGDWYVAEDFIARALAVVLLEPLRSAGTHHYRLGSVTKTVLLGLINRPDQVRLIISTQRGTRTSFIEFADRIEVGFGAELIEVQFSPVQPNPEIVSSISQEEDVLIIRKGTRYDRLEKTQSLAGDELVIDLLGLPSSIVTLPPPSTHSPSPLHPSPEAGAKEFRSPRPFGHLQDWRLETIDQRRSTVVIDPGHGGRDLGVTWGDAAEKDINLDVAFLIQGVLERAGHSCQLTRTRDVNLPLEQRSGVANHYQPRVFVSIHVGGAPSSSTRSSTVYIHDRSTHTTRGKRRSTQESLAENLVHWEEAQKNYNTQSNQLGRLIQRQLGTLSENPTVIAKAPLAVLTSVAAPAVLVEIGYLTNPSQREKLISENHRALVAESIAACLLRFLQASD